MIAPKSSTLTKVTGSFVEHLDGISSLMSVKTWATMIRKVVQHQDMILSKVVSSKKFCTPRIRVLNRSYTPKGCRTSLNCCTLVSLAKNFALDKMTQKRACEKFKPKLSSVVLQKLKTWTGGLFTLVNSWPRFAHGIARCHSFPAHSLGMLICGPCMIRISWCSGRWLEEVANVAYQLGRKKSEIPRKSDYPPVLR